MLEALWSVEFVSNSGVVGAGVVIFESSRIFGGDSQYYYVGNYKVKDSKVSARIVVEHYSGNPSSVFGTRKNFTILVEGDVGEKVMEVHGQIEDEPESQISIRLTRRAELP